MLVERRVVVDWSLVRVWTTSAVMVMTVLLDVTTYVVGVVLMIGDWVDVELREVRLEDDLFSSSSSMSSPSEPLPP